jgi:TolB-like protein/DNA-binding winged helix-turn-helix (wHTH) protein/tetratricopeptide (TPR) repeat protein
MLETALNFRFAEFEIDVARHELRRAGTVVRVEPQVFDLLVHLIENRHRTVSKDELIDAIWQGRIISDATLTSRISAARRALGDSGNDQSLIRTLHKRGFRFVGAVEEDNSAPLPIAVAKAPPVQDAVDPDAPAEATGEALHGDEPSIAPVLAAPRDKDQEPSDAPALAASPPGYWDHALDAGGADAILLADPAAGSPATEEEAAPHGRRRARNLLLAVAAIGLVSSLVAGVWWLLLSAFPSSNPQPNDRMTLATAPSAAERLEAATPSIVVLPFVNLSGDAQRDYLVDGITDSLISDLARALPGISIVSRDTAFTYKGRRVDARRIGRELAARYLLEGSVVLEGERVRVNTRLVETKDATQLWAERFDTERTSILQIQDEIGRRVSRAIGLQVIDIEARRSRRERPDSAELIDLVMRGKAVLNLPSSAATMIEARGLFEAALKVEPANVDGLAGVATTLVFEFLNGYYETGAENRLRTAELLLDRALTTEPRHLMALKAKAALRRAQGRFDDAIVAAEAIIMENPGEPWAYKEVGLSNLYLGKPEEALEWFAKADRIGPRDPGRWTWLDGRGHALILLGRDEDAVRALTSALDANPRYASARAFLAAAYALLGRTDEARAALAAYEQARPGTRVSTFRTRAPVPLALTSPTYQQLRARLAEGLRQAGMPE